MGIKSISLIDEEDLRVLMKSIQMNIDGLRNSEIDIETRVNVSILSQLALKHSVEKAIYKLREAN